MNNYKATILSTVVVVFTANQKAELDQEPITAELELVSFVSAMILCLKTQIKMIF